MNTPVATEDAEQMPTDPVNTSPAETPTDDAQAEAVGNKPREEDEQPERNPLHSGRYSLRRSDVAGNAPQIMALMRAAGWQP